MEKLEMLYEGKAKKVFNTKEKDLIVIHFKDDATAFNGIKKAQIANKGIINNRISTILYNYLHNEGIPTHFIESDNEREQLCKKVEIIPLEVIVRNVIAGSLAKKLSLEEGTVPSNVIKEICYKEDELGDPMINDHHAVALGICSYEELNKIYDLADKINNVLKKVFNEINVILVDFKMEFGRTNDGQIILADEISPDTCRLWDSKTKDKLDKDRFRRDLGKVFEAYDEIYQRLMQKRS